MAGRCHISVEIANPATHEVTTMRFEQASGELFHMSPDTLHIEGTLISRVTRVTD